MKSRALSLRVLAFTLGPTALAIGLACGALGACSTNGATSSNDAGFDAFSDFDGDQVDAAPESSCETISEWQQACAPNDTCAAHVAASCQQIDTAYSQGALIALEQCYADATSACGAGDAGDTTDLVNECFSQQLAQVLPTATQLKLADDYCARCDAKNPGCGGGFYTGQDGSAGIGIQYITMSDAIVAQIDSTCAAGASDAGDGGSCIDAFSTCATNVYASKVPTLSCNADAGDGGP